MPIIWGNASGQSSSSSKTIPFSSTSQPVLSGAAAFSWALQHVPFNDAAISKEVSGILSAISERKTVNVPSEILNAIKNATITKHSIYYSPQFNYLMQTATSKANRDDIIANIVALHNAILSSMRSMRGGAASSSSLMKSAAIGAAVAAIAKYALKKDSRSALEFGTVAGVSGFLALM